MIFTESRKFGDLTDEEKAAVIGGIAFVLTFVITFIVFFQLFVVNDELRIMSLGKRLRLPLLHWDCHFCFS